MSANFNFKKNKCWSCEFFCGRREYKKGFFFGTGVYNDDTGTCTNKRSSYNGKNVLENNWCSKYQKWGVLQSAIAIEEQKKAQKEAERKQQSFANQEYNNERHSDNIIQNNQNDINDTINEKKNTHIVLKIIIASIFVILFIITTSARWDYEYMLEFANYYEKINPATIKEIENKILLLTLLMIGEIMVFSSLTISVILNIFNSKHNK